MPTEKAERPSWLPERTEAPVEGAMAVPGHVAAVEAAIEAEVRLPCVPSTDGAPPVSMPFG